MPEWTPADLKATLAEHGQTMKPDATMRYVERPKPGEPVGLVVLERVVKDTLPDYCVHGYATCINCNFPCWIGHETEKVLTGDQNIFAVCLDCAPQMIPEGTEPSQHLEDHRRADGPHE